MCMPPSWACFNVVFQEKLPAIDWQGEGKMAHGWPSFCSLRCLAPYCLTRMATSLYFKAKQYMFHDTVVSCNDSGDGCNAEHKLPWKKHGMYIYFTSFTKLGNVSIQEGYKPYLPKATLDSCGLILNQCFIMNIEMASRHNSIFTALM